MSERTDEAQEPDAKLNNEVALPTVGEGVTVQPTGDDAEIRLPYDVVPEAPWSRTVKWILIALLVIFAGWGISFVHLELARISTIQACERPSALIQLIQGVPFFAGMAAAVLSFVGHLLSYLAPYIAGAVSAGPLLPGETKPARRKRLAHLSLPAVTPDNAGRQKRQTMDRLGTVFRFVGAGVAVAAAIIAWMLLNSLSLLNGIGACK